MLLTNIEVILEKLIIQEKLIIGGGGVVLAKIMPEKQKAF